jgi:hypothetical protein
MVKTCHICGDLHVEYKNKSRQRHRYFCSIEHAAQYMLPKINKNIPKQYQFQSTKQLLNNKEFKLSTFFDKL